MFAPLLCDVQSVTHLFLNIQGKFHEIFFARGDPSKFFYTLFTHISLSLNYPSFGLLIQPLFLDLLGYDQLPHRNATHALTA